MNTYFCTLKPLGEYFLGGERTFGFRGRGKKDGEVKGKNEYYIRSEEIPSQATVFGALRFLVLLAHGKLNDEDSGVIVDRAETESLIGANGFSIDHWREENSYGLIESIGPVFLWEEKSKTPLIPTPLNHKVNDENKKENEIYRPFSLSGVPVYSDQGEGGLLPTDYVAKDGIASSFLRLEKDGTGKIVRRNDIFGGQEHTRIFIDRAENGSQEKSFFKKEYKYLKQAKDASYAFGFYCKAAEGAFPNGDAVVYLGQDKSPFLFRWEQFEGEALFERALPLNPGPLPEGIHAYYVCSDTLVTENFPQNVAYAVISRRQIRTLVTRGRADMPDEERRRNYRDRRYPSRLYQLIRAGSVLYLRGDDPVPAGERTLKKVGFNYIVEIGGKA